MPNQKGILKYVLCPQNYSKTLDVKETIAVKRDLELIRKLVLAAEENATGYILNDIQIEGYTPEQIGYHSYLVIDGGLAQGEDITTHDDTSPNWKILHLTSAGHDFADAVRDESTWRKATGLVKAQGGSVTLDVMKQVLVSIIKNALGL